jgi:hypothetical protein
LDAFTIGSTDGEMAFYILENSLQNGAPDGLALADGTQVLQFLSYEGSFVAADGVAAGLRSTDIGVSEPANTFLGASLQLAGSGDSYFDFTWQGPLAHSQGYRNANQVFLTEPEPPAPQPPANPGAVPEPPATCAWLILLAISIPFARALRNSRRD